MDVEKTSTAAAPPAAAKTAAAVKAAAAEKAAAAAKAAAAKKAAAASTVKKSQASRQKLAEDLDQFMTLLVTQLQHQDPLDPMDPNEFTSQLVQFAGVEQQIQGNSNLEDMLKLQQTSLLGTAVSYIGKLIEVEGNKMPLENGYGRADYKLLSDAENTTITVTHSSGRVVVNTSGQTTAGKHSFQWDGKDKYGFPVPDGTYTIDVSALNREGKPVKIAQTVTGTVTGVSVDNGVTTLSLGPAEYGVEDIISVRHTVEGPNIVVIREPVAETAATTDEGTPETPDEGTPEAPDEGTTETTDEGAERTTETTGTADEDVEGTDEEPEETEETGEN